LNPIATVIVKRKGISHNGRRGKFLGGMSKQINIPDEYYDLFMSLLDMGAQFAEQQEELTDLENEVLHFVNHRVWEDVSQLEG